MPERRVAEPSTCADLMPEQIEGGVVIRVLHPIPLPPPSLGPLLVHVGEVLGQAPLLERAAHLERIAVKLSESRSRRKRAEQQLGPTLRVARQVDLDRLVILGVPASRQEQVFACLHELAEVQEQLPVALVELRVVAAGPDVAAQYLLGAPRLAALDGFVDSLV